MKIAFFIVVLLLMNFKATHLAFLKSKHKNNFQNEVTATSTTSINKKQILIRPNIFSTNIISFQNCPFLRCKTCRLSQCTECDSKYYLYDSKCSISCPPGTFVLNSECVKCDSSCPICWDKYSCGSIKGLNAKVVNLKQEIFDLIEKNDFSLNVEDKELMLENLRLILSDDLNLNMNMNIKSNGRSLNKKLSLIEVYKDNASKSNKIIDLPIYSFSENNGTYLLVPGFNVNVKNNVDIADKDKINDNVKNNNITNKSKWIFKQGYWNGYSWNTSPNFYLVPSFIKERGDKGKIYLEGTLFWYFNEIENKWTYSNIMSEKNKTNNISMNVDNYPTFDVIKANNRKVKFNLYKKLDNINNKINSYLKKFEENNVILDISKFIDEEKDSIDTKINQFKKSLSNINITN